MLNNNSKSNENNNTNKGDDNMNNLQDLTKLINGVSAFLKEVQGVTSLEEQAVNQLANVLANNLGLVKEIETVTIEKVVEVPVETVKEVIVEKEVEVIKEVPVEIIKEVVVEDTSRLNELQAKIDEQESIIEQLAECVEESNTTIEQQQSELAEAARLMQVAIDEISELNSEIDKLNKLQNEQDSDEEFADFESDDETDINSTNDDTEQEFEEVANVNNEELMVHSDCKTVEIDSDDDILDFIMETEYKTEIEELSFDDQPEEPVQKPKKLKRNTGFKNRFEPAVYINEDTSNNDEIFEKQLSYMNIIEEDTSNNDEIFEKQLSYMNIIEEDTSNNVQDMKPRRTNRKQSQYDQYGNPRETRNIKSEIKSESSNDTTTAMDYLKRVKSNEVNFEYILANRKEFEDMCTLWLSINMNQLPIEISNLKVELFKHDLEDTNLDN